MLALSPWNRLKTLLWWLPNTKVFRRLVVMPCVAVCLWYASKYLASVLIYNDGDESTSGGATSGRKWYQISKVPEVEGTYNIFGFDF